MKKQDIAKRIARQSGVSRAVAADRLDRVVNQILADLRQGRKTSLPGLGTFSQDGDGRALFERDRGGDDTSQD
jgi:nucleoid DNA-binding protein